MSQAKVYLIGIGILIGAVLLSYRFKETPIAPEPLFPLIKHTITVGNVARVVYLERWTDETNLTSCTDYNIVWPAKASKGYIDMMLENAKGEMVNEYIQIGWWKPGEVFLPVVIE